MIPLVPEVPDIPLVPSIPLVPLIPDVPDVPSTPLVPEVPFIPDVPSIPLVPLTPLVPEVPEPPPLVPVDPETIFPLTSIPKLVIDVAEPIVLIFKVFAVIVVAETLPKVILLSKFKTTVDVPDINEPIFVPPEIVSVAFGFGAVIVVAASPLIFNQLFVGGEDAEPSTNSILSK